MLLLLALMLSQLDLAPQLSDTGPKFDPACQAWTAVFLRFSAVSRQKLASFCSETRK
jgi:hypothetical protein